MKLREWFERLDDRLLTIDKTLVRHEENLREHMRRTELLEAAIRPVEKQVNYVRGALKLISLIAVLAGILAAIWKVLH